jgi:hypothetical protein
MMPDFFSTQLTAIDAVPAQAVEARDLGGTVKAAYFAWTGDAAQNDNVYLTELPSGARVVGGSIEFTALGASVTAEVRTETTANAFLAAGADVSSATQFVLDRAARGVGYTAGAPTTGRRAGARERVYAVLSGANPAAGTIRGVVLYTLAA